MEYLILLSKYISFSTFGFELMFLAQYALQILPA